MKDFYIEFAPSVITWGSDEVITEREKVPMLGKLLAEKGKVAQ